jgi:hypothetical protein
MRAGYPVNPAQIHNGNTTYETGFYLSKRANARKLQKAIAKAQRTVPRRRYNRRVPGSD